MTGPDALVPFGWNARVAARVALVAGDEPGAVPGRVTRIDRGAVTVATASGLQRAVPGAEPLATGDWVLLDGDEDAPAVVALVSRHSAFVRGDPMDGAARGPQVVAANVDTVFVTQSVESGPNLRRLERELVLAYESGADPVVVLTKADLADEPIPLEEVARSAAGAPVVVTSAVTGEGIDELRAYARPGCTVALIGASGAGKSTLVNRLVGSEVRSTGAVRDRDRRGRHTTVTRELVALPGGGVLVDTPGLRAVTLWTAADGFRRAFADIEARATDCRFRDCAHDREPGCAVQLAVQRGEIDAARVRHYRELDAELDRVERSLRERAARADRRVRRRA